MIDKIINEYFVCEVCGAETDIGFLYKGKYLCTDCFKKVKKEKADVKTNDKR